MSWIMVDVEADGLMHDDYSMISFGVIVVEEGTGIEDGSVTSDARDRGY